MTLKEFAKLAAKDGKEGRTSKWIRRHPVASRALLGSAISGAVSAKKGERGRSAIKGLGADVLGGLAGGAITHRITSHLMPKVKSLKALLALGGAGVGVAGLSRFGVGIPLARRWQKKHEKTGPAK